MNPELLRQVWTELTLRRIASMLIGVGLILLVTGLGQSEDQTLLERLADSAAWMFGALAFIWAGRNAAQSVVGEVRDRTWDVQRMTALSAFDMTWGKLLGSTAFPWIGALIVLAVLGLRALEVHTMAHALWLALAALTAGIGFQAASMALGLAAIRRLPMGAGLRVDPLVYVILLCVVFGMGSGVLLVDNMLGPQIAYTLGGDEAARYAITQWWGLNFHADSFLALMSAMVCVVGLFCAWRLMRLELGHKPQPWALFAGLAIPMIIIAGQAFNPVMLDADGGAFSPWSRILAAWLVFALVLIHALALLEPKIRVEWRRTIAATSQRGWLGTLWSLPATIQVLALAGVLAVLGPAIAYGLGDHYATDNVLRWDYPLALVFMSARNVGVFAYFHSGLRQNRGDFAALVTLALFHVLLLSLAELDGFGIVGALVWPVENGPAGLSLAVMGVEALIVWGLALARWRASEQLAKAA